MNTKANGFIGYVTAIFGVACIIFISSCGSVKLAKNTGKNYDDAYFSESDYNSSEVYNKINEDRKAQALSDAESSLQNRRTSSFGQSYTDRINNFGSTRIQNVRPNRTMAITPIITPGGFGIMPSYGFMNPMYGMNNPYMMGYYNPYGMNMYNPMFGNSFYNPYGYNMYNNFAGSNWTYWNYLYNPYWCTNMYNPYNYGAGSYNSYGYWGNSGTTTYTKPKTNTIKVAQPASSHNPSLPSGSSRSGWSGNTSWGSSGNNPGGGGNSTPVIRQSSGNTTSGSQSGTSGRKR